MTRQLQKYSQFRLFVAATLVGALCLPLLVHTCVWAGSKLLLPGHDCCPDREVETAMSDEGEPCELHIDLEVPAGKDFSTDGSICCTAETISATDSTVVNIRTEVIRIVQLVVSYLDIHLLRPAIEYLRDAVSRFDFAPIAENPTRTHLLNRTFLL